MIILKRVVNILCITNIGYRTMETIVDMANGAVTGRVLKAIPVGHGDRTICAPSVEFHVQCLGYISPQSYNLYRYMAWCACNKHDILIGLTLPRKSQRYLKTDRGWIATCPVPLQKRNASIQNRSHACNGLELIHGDLVDPTPMESVSHRRYGFVLMDGYSHANWMPLESQIQYARRVGSMDDEYGEQEYCESKLIPYSPLLNGVAKRLVGMATNAYSIARRAERMTTFMHLRKRIPTRA